MIIRLLDIILVRQCELLRDQWTHCIYCLLSVWLMPVDWINFVIFRSKIIQFLNSGFVEESLQYGVGNPCFQEWCILFWNLPSVFFVQHDCVEDNLFRFIMRRVIMSFPPILVLRVNHSNYVYSNYITDHIIVFILRICWMLDILFSLCEMIDSVLIQVHMYCAVTPVVMTNEVGSIYWRIRHLCFNCACT